MSRPRLEFEGDEMQATAVALFGECPICGALLEPAGECLFADEHPVDPVADTQRAPALAAE